MSVTSPEILPSLERMQQELDEISIQLAEARVPFLDAPLSWRPAVNAYRCANEFVVYVDIAGVPPEAVQLEVSPHRLRLRGSRRSPEPAGERDPGQLVQLLALEIDGGSFERTLELPCAVDPQDVTTQYREGILRIRLPLASQG